MERLLKGRGYFVFCILLGFALSALTIGCNEKEAKGEQESNLTAKAETDNSKDLSIKPIARILGENAPPTTWTRGADGTEKLITAAGNEIDFKSAEKEKADIAEERSESTETTYFKPTSIKLVLIGAVFILGGLILAIKFGEIMLGGAVALAGVTIILLATYPQAILLLIVVAALGAYWYYRKNLQGKTTEQKVSALSLTLKNLVNAIHKAEGLSPEIKAPKVVEAIKANIKEGLETGEKKIVKAEVTEIKNALGID